MQEVRREKILAATQGRSGCGLCWTVASGEANTLRMKDRPVDKNRQDTRKDRLRAALRANLQRRKAQARARAAEDTGDRPNDRIGQQDSDTGKDDA